MKTFQGLAKSYGIGTAFAAMGLLFTAHSARADLAQQIQEATDVAKEAKRARRLACKSLNEELIPAYNARFGAVSEKIARLEAEKAVAEQGLRFAQTSFSSVSEAFAVSRGQLTAFERFKPLTDQERARRFKTEIKQYISLLQDQAQALDEIEDRIQDDSSCSGRGPCEATLREYEKARDKYFKVTDQVENALSAIYVTTYSTLPGLLWIQKNYNAVKKVYDESNASKGPETEKSKSAHDQVREASQKLAQAQGRLPGEKLAELPKACK